jgi:ubiquinone/menaquinone biosynthesis C-methylase UbiE
MNEERDRKKFGPIRRDGYDSRKYGEADFWENTTPFRGELFNAIDKSLEELGIDIRKGKVLEVGVGAGIFMDFLEARGVDIVGIDARVRGLKAAEGKIVEGRIEQMPFPNDTFQTVIGIGIFDRDVYDQDEEAMVKDIARVLKEGGVCIFEGFPPDILPEGFTDVSRHGLHIWQKTRG